MPLYTSQCKCGKVAEYYSTVAARDEVPRCCGKKVKRIITAPAMVMDDIQPYQSMVTGEMITSRSRHREHLRDHGMIEVGNEKQTRRPPPEPNWKETLIRVTKQKLGRM